MTGNIPKQPNLCRVQRKNEAAFFWLAEEQKGGQHRLRINQKTCGRFWILSNQNKSKGRV